MLGCLLDEDVCGVVFSNQSDRRYVILHHITIRRQSGCLGKAEIALVPVFHFVKWIRSLEVDGAAAIRISHIKDRLAPG